MWKSKKYRVTGELMAIATGCWVAVDTDLWAVGFAVYYALSHMAIARYLLANKGS